MDIVTWNAYEASLIKEPTIFKDFVYDTQTDEGILNKISDVKSIMDNIEEDINSILEEYDKLQNMYNEFTNYDEKMKINIQKLNESLKQTRLFYRNLLESIKEQVNKLRTNDEELNEDLTNLYNMIGEINNKIKPSPEDKLKQIYPNGAPKTPEEAYKDIVTVEVPITTKDGVRTTTKLNLNKAIAEDVKNALQEAQDAGFVIYDVQGYNWKGDEDHLSQHCYGLAIDINVAENPCVSMDLAGNPSTGWDPKNNEYSIGINSPVVQAFEKIGWSWGGYWSTKKDYMHFSYTNS